MQISDSANRALPLGKSEWRLATIMHTYPVHFESCGRSRNFGQRLAQAALGLLLSCAFAQPPMAEALDCEELIYRISGYTALTTAIGRELKYEAKDKAVYRFDASGRRIRLITFTPENEACIENLVTFADFTDSGLREADRGRRPAQSLPAQAAFEEQEFDISDLNGDGVTDAVGLSNGDVLYVFRGNNTEELGGRAGKPAGGAAAIAR